MHQFLKFIFGIELYMFRRVSLFIIRSFSLYTQQWYMSYRFANIHHCCVYSEKLLMMDRENLRNMLSSIPKINLRVFSPARKLSANLYDIHHCCVYSEKLLMMNRETLRNM